MFKSVQRKAEKLYEPLLSCKQGWCYECPRYDKTESNNYECKKRLLEDCFDLTALILSIDVDTMCEDYYD